MTSPKSVSNEPTSWKVRHQRDHNASTLTTNRRSTIHNKNVRNFLSKTGPPSGPLNITNTITLLNATSFMLKWTRPPQDGGDPQLKYDIEYSKPNSEGKFVHWNSRKSITGQEYNVTGLERGSRYEFRVFVSNIAGRKREPASKEFNVIMGDDEGPGPGNSGSCSFVIVATP